MAAVIFSGNDVKTLKSNIDLNGNSKILSGTTDPSSVATSANKGSLYLNTSTGAVYRKTDNGSSTNWTQIVSTDFSASNLFQNGSITASVAANALTVALKDAAGSDPSGGSVVRIGFRSSTVTSGVYNIRSVSSSLSMTVSSGSTLGHASGVDHYVYVYLIDNAGTPELAVSSALFEEGSVVSTTAEGGAGGADTFATLYSTTARSNVPVRLIGRLKVNEATAGTWATSPSEISTIPFKTAQVPGNTTADTANFGISASFGTTSNEKFNRWRVGDRMYSEGYFTAGTTTGAAAELTLPPDVRIDTSKLVRTSANVSRVGTWTVFSSATENINSNDREGAVFSDGSNTDKLYFSYQVSGGEFPKQNANTFVPTGAGIHIKFDVPVVGWTIS